MKIKEIYSASTPSRVANSNKQKCHYVSYDNLPVGTKERFKKRVVPLSLDVTGVTGTGLDSEQT